MDTLAHGLWGGMIAGWKRRFGLAFLFGTAPDLLSFGALMALRILQGRFHPGKPSLDTIPPWVHTSYDFTHSLVLVGGLWWLLWLKKRDLAVPFSAWPLHILFDIPTHSREFFPTPFLFPISRFTVDGISWGQRWFMILNYSCLSAFSIVWLVHRHRARKKRDSLKVSVRAEAASPKSGSEPQAD
ncbi:hypothetical protein LLH00_15120 [bacterium]|nr:hypothetical protein [bacterium]